MADVVDQSQTASPSLDDWNSGNGQTFTTGMTGYLKGIKLFLNRQNGLRDLTLEVRHVGTDNFPTGPVLASGTLKGETVPLGPAQWYTVEFGTPYLQALGEKLSFTLQYGPAGTPYGYMNFGTSGLNPYSGGLMYSVSQYGSSVLKNYDLAFQTLIATSPEPPPFETFPFETSLSFVDDETVEISISASSTNHLYTVVYKESLSEEKWSECDAATGTQNPITWQFSVDKAIRQLFFKVLETPLN